MSGGSAPTVSKSEAKERDDYRAKDDARTLSDAEAIRADSGRMERARRHLEHSVAALNKTLKRTGKRRKSSRRT